MGALHAPTRRASRCRGGAAEQPLVLRRLGAGAREIGAPEVPPETCILGAGTWYVGVNGYATTTHFTLDVTRGK